MPVTNFNPTVELLGFNELLDYATTQTGLPTADVLQAINAEYKSKFFSSSLTFEEAKSEALQSWLNSQGFTVEYNGNGSWSGSAFQNVAQVTEQPSVVNSNNTSIFRGNIRQMYGNVKEFDGSNYFMQMSRFPASGGLGQKALYVLGSVGSGVAAVSTGIWLGKVISPLLYQANPNFWESIGVSEGSFNPEAWASITNGSDSPFAGLFNFILGLNPDTGESQMYMDANTLAYMAYALKENGFFDSPTYIVGSNPDPSVFTNVNIPIYGNKGSLMWSWQDGNTLRSEVYTDLTDPNSMWFLFDVVDSYVGQRTHACSSLISGTHTFLETSYRNGTISGTRQFTLSPSSYTYNGVTVYTYSANNINNRKDIATIPLPTESYANRKDIPKQGWLIYFGDAQGGVSGVSDQPNATLPDVSNWNDIPSTLQSLQQQYPDAFNNGMTWNNDSPYDDSIGNTTTWVPVPMPNTTSATDTQPTSGTQTQTSTDVLQLPQTLIDLLTQIVQQTQPQTETQSQIPPQNPVDTGTGSSPVPSAPTGSASALWSVYHPTQAQIDAFGGWLWGSVFTTDIRKLFEDPIQGVIKLHKVFATPVDSGTGTIVVGTLDSNVASATVTQQYVTVDCGSVDCFEDFGNVFDYPPFTDISLYLPFIGIVPLDTNDVMRSTIHVIYGVDVFTGACLAMVEINRDGSTVNMYQYAGVCSVDYPLSNVQASNMLSGLLTMGAGIASIVATGGISAPAAGAAIGGAAATLKRSVGRSGGFSGNSGAMGIKTPYIILERPQTKVAETFKNLAGYPTNYSCKLGDCSGHVVVKHVHVEGVTATDTELAQIESLLKDGVLI